MILSLQPRIRGAILDLDGTLWRSDTPIGDLPSIFKRFAELEIRPILATNNATLNISQYLTKLEGFGVCLDPYQVINSGQAAAYLLRSRFPQGRKVYIVGEDGLHRALAEAGFVHSDDSDVLAVVAGMDRRITFEKLTRAAEAIRAGAVFIGTNPDTTFPMPGGKLIPGAGSILAAIAAASGVEPIIAGKPERAMFDLALERLGTLPDETISVGDRLETDIDGGQRAGCRTALVLSGVTTAEGAQSWQPRPDLIARDVTQLLAES